MNLRKLSKEEKIPYNLLLLADETVESINRYIFDSEIFVLEQNCEAIAVYAMQKLNADEAEIKNIAVAPDFQGRGLGKLLLNNATNRAKVQGFKAILIGTGDVATKQLALYQKVGFKKFGVRKNFFVENFPEPIFEGGVQLKDMVVLKKELT